MSNQNKRENFMHQLATVLVQRRKFIFILYVIAIIFSLVSMGWTEVENDITKYLPDDTETKRGIVAMSDSFSTIATARIMVSNITVETAYALQTDILNIENVSMVVFDNTPEHYTNASALFDVTFNGSTGDTETIAAVEAIKSLLNKYDTSLYTDVGTDLNAMLMEEMGVILIVAVIIIIVVLTLTSQSFAEVPVLLLTFGVAALLNMGTNFIFGKISFISNSIAVVLQLALAIDYAIILCHRFTHERETMNAEDAAISALSKSIPEIFASSLTTVSGLLALAFMKFQIGMDMSMVLIKSILLSLLSVFTFMPGLLVAFSPLLERTKHTKLLPDVSFLGKFAVKSRRILPPIFLIVIIAAFIASSYCPFCYSFTDLKTAKMTESQQAYFDIKDQFGTSNMVAVLVPAGDYQAERKLLEELETYPEVKSTMGLANIEAMNGYMLTDSLTPRQLSELMDIDYEIVQALYTAYAAEHSQIGEIINGIAQYRIPLFDMFMYLKDQMDTYHISLDMEGMNVSDLLAQLDTAKKQLQSDDYSRMVVYLTLPEESQETFDFLETIRSVIGKYYESDYFVLGNSTSSRDLSSSFVQDNLLISILSAVFVIIVLILTFKSAGMSVLLILVIQGSIWINFSVPTITGQPLFFLGYLIVQALQMGANIDYAIVISSHYQEMKQKMHHKEAIIHAVNDAFPTVFTSGTIMASAGLLIGNMSTQPVISIMGLCIGRGTIISIILVLVILPSILVLGDSIINRTSFKLKGITIPTLQNDGTVKIHGRIHGYVNGEIDGEFYGTVTGKVDATISTQTHIQKGDHANEN